VVFKGSNSQMGWMTKLKEMWGVSTNGSSNARVERANRVAITAPQPAPSARLTPREPRSSGCQCGCKGQPYSGQTWIDIRKYKDCPARRQRKIKEGVAKAGTRERLKAKAIAEKERQAVRAAEEKRLERKRVDQQLAEAEANRARAGEPALSKQEALRRKLPTFQGSRCALDHSGERDARNGECVVCRLNDKRIRFAMKRGAFPEDLTDADKSAIAAIYDEAKRLTQSTGILHHVDHVRPLAHGGRHHPTNLQILTATENLSKGAKWDGRDAAK
jgi:hypothetical protein